MKQFLYLLTTIFIFYNCTNPTGNVGKLVTNEVELNTAIANAKPGDNIIMANGIWKDIEIRLS